MSTATHVNDEAIVSVSRASGTLVVSPPGAMPSKPKRDERYSYSDIIEFWGKDNLEPQHILKDAKSNALLYSVLDFVVRAVYSGGIMYGYEEGEGNEMKFVPQQIDEIDQLLKCSNHSLQLIKGLQGLKFFRIAFPELIVSKDRKKIVMVQYNQSSFCRWAKHNSKGLHPYVYINANWDITRRDIQDGLTLTVPVLDTFYDPIQNLKAAKGFKYIYPEVHFPTPGNSYYPEPAWNPIRTSGWLTYANQIPKLKEAYMKNATHLKYIIHIPNSWWKWKYPQWDNYKKEERKSIVQKEHSRFDKFLRGIENAGKSLLMTFKDDPNMIKHGYTKWEIKLLEKDVIDGILKDDVLETTQMIYSATGVHGTLMGSTPGGSESGSGSNQKQAYNIFMALSQLEQDLVVKPFEFAAEYNGYPGLKFKFRKLLIADLKEVSPSKRQD
ncbi:MAG: hypothetical protein ACPGJS_00640 [Flammeovirgaceae bacterium]